jgi:two-component system OmpR family sensor kinase
VSLRLRLLALVAGLAIVALVAAEAATYLALRSFLYSQIDRTVSASVDVLGDSLAAGHTITATDLATLVSTTPGLYVGDLGKGRQVTWQALGVARGAHPAPAPALDHLGAVSDNDTAPPITVDARSGDLHYRVAVEPIGTNQAILLAAPLDNIDDTLTQLLTIEVIVSAIAIAGVVAAGAWLITVSLRPLSRIERTASAIAAGDLSHRVEDARPTTEVGRLALAFNAMIARIEAAFAEQSESERVLRQFVADASHELRTPLTAVRAYAELFDRGARYRPDDLERAMGGIQREAARMSVLVDDLLLLARLDQHPEVVLRDVDLAEVAHLATEASHAIDPERTITVIAPESVIVRGDPAALRRVVDNLLANVRSHTPARTPATVRVTPQGTHVILEVADRGPGLPPDLAAHVFERFSRGDASRSRDAGGSGLGLAIVAAIVEAHGGSVSVTTNTGAGATFAVSLPVDRDRPAGQTAVPFSPESEPNGK